MKTPKIIECADGTVLIERFSPFRRIEHVVVIVVFVALALTGIPQKFYETATAAWLLKIFGGLDSAREIHRLAGLVFTAHLGMHVLIMVVGVLTSKMRMSLMPTSKDFHDIIDTLRFYFGFRKNPPAYGKFDYRQKFEYLGIVLGGMVMALSGIALLFPGAISHLMSGEVILAARVAHSNEALLAMLVLVVWHIYGSHLSPEVFPMDQTIFTGYITKEELAERHAQEYERLFGELPKHDSKAQSEKGSLVTPVSGE